MFNYIKQIKMIPDSQLYICTMKDEESFQNLHILIKEEMEKSSPESTGLYTAPSRG